MALPALFDLTGQTALITGSSRGIGKAIAHRMAEHGANVVISSTGVADRKGYSALVEDLMALFFPEHTHIPTSRRTPFPSGGELPKKYKHTHDPFVALSFAAAATHKLKIGTGIALIPQRDPFVTAKSARHISPHHVVVIHDVRRNAPTGGDIGEPLERWREG